MVDCHVDLPYHMMQGAPNTMLSDLDQGPFTLEKARQAGIRLFGTALYCEDAFNGPSSVERLEAILEFTLDRFHGVKIIGDLEGLQKLNQDPDELATLLLLENADALADALDRIEEFRESGIGIVGLTHMGRNRLAQGNGVSYPDGFTEAGKTVVRTLEKTGIIIDIAHLHPVCFWELLDLIPGPVITSHTGVFERCPIPRNINLDQAREIADRGGIMGLSFNPEMLSLDPRVSIEEVFAHMDALVQRLGPLNVGIGSDFCGFSVPAEGLEDIGHIPNLISIMNAHGYGQEAIDDIMGLNWMRLFEGLF
jgi:membrane dipeptidase